MNFFIDIETVPSQKPGELERLLNTIKHPGNITKPESITKWYSENSEKAAIDEWKKQSFDGLYGEIISIAWAFGDDAPTGVYRYRDESEYVLLAEFFHEITHYRDEHLQLVYPTRWIGHYITGFDLRFIWQRCVMLDIKPIIKIPYDAKPWDDAVYDTKIAWTGLSHYSGAGSLDEISRGFGFSGKEGDITGATVFDEWRTGRIKDIFEYNKHDVEMTRQLFKKMNFLK